MICYTTRDRIPFEIDDDNWEIVSRYSWCVAKGYIATNARIHGKYRSIGLHQLLFGLAPKGMEWDHKDRNPLNNHENNLRIVTHQINQRNTNLRADNPSGVKGVTKCGQKWMLRISDSEGVSRYLGLFPTIEDAKQARVTAEAEFWK